MLFFSDGIQLHYLINHIGEIFSVLILIEMLISNTSIPANWSKYCKKLKSYSNAPESLNLTEEKFCALNGAVYNIAVKMMNDDIVQNSLRNISALRKTFIGKNSSLVAGEFNQYLKQAIINLDKLLQEQGNGDNMYKCIKVNALFVLNAHLFGNNDNKVFKSLMELNTKVHTFLFYGALFLFLFIVYESF